MSTKVKPVWIGVQGGTCSGKTPFVKALSNYLGHSRTLILCLDLFYQPCNRLLQKAEPTTINFDHPAAADWNLIRQVCHNLHSGSEVSIPSYDYISGNRAHGSLVKPKAYIIVEGLWPFYDTYLMDLFQLRVFVDTPADIRLVRRLEREFSPETSRGWTLQEALSYYKHCARPMHEEFVEPGKNIAHFIVSDMANFSNEAKRVFEASGITQHRS